MHPLVRRPLRLALYVLAWIPAGLVLAALLQVARPRPWMHALVVALPLAVVYAFAVLSAWWVCRAHPMGGIDDDASHAVTAQVRTAVQTTIVWVALATTYSVALNSWTNVHAARAHVFRDGVVLLLAGIPLYLLSAAFHYLVLAVERSHAAERRVLESHVTAREAELRALRAQLNPHFLFNSLNSINALVGADPDGARRMCETLGDFLRRTLALGARDVVTLGDELALVDRYLAIEQVRFGERLRIERTVDPAAAACRVPPLLLQPLVENAIKHGIQHCVEGGTVRIGAERVGRTVRVVVDNPMEDGAPSVDGSGVGLANVRRRMEVFGARDARLDAARHGGRFRVTLELPALADDTQEGA